MSLQNAFLRLKYKLERSQSFVSQLLANASPHLTSSHFSFFFQLGKPRSLSTCPTISSVTGSQLLSMFSSQDAVSTNSVAASTSSASGAFDSNASSSTLVSSASVSAFPFPHRKSSLNLPPPSSISTSEFFGGDNPHSLVDESQHFQNSSDASASSISQQQSFMQHFGGGGGGGNVTNGGAAPQNHYPYSTSSSMHTNGGDELLGLASGTGTTSRKMNRTINSTSTSGLTSIGAGPTTRKSLFSGRVSFYFFVFQKQSYFCRKN